MRNHEVKRTIILVTIFVFVEIVLFLLAIHFFGIGALCILPIIVLSLFGVLIVVERFERSRREREQKEEDKLRERRWREEDKLREREYEKEKERLEIEIPKLEKPYIKFFVEKYGIGDTERKDELLELLKVKGLEMETSHLDRLIEKEIERNKEENFLRIVNYRSPKTIDGYCSIFLNRFGDRYGTEDLQMLERLLISKGLYLELEGLEELEIMIREMQKEKRIRSLEKKFSERDGEYFDIKRIDSMGGFEFEGLVAQLYKSMGYDVRNTPLTGDQGADLVIEKFGEKTAVQIKRS
ncbi:MAG: restriction endonuclease, partial [Candidatus Heimdallarchaeota archaeon]|nr:restriction endonuclease [Candidatus Heimdallarchaeota archaeon]